MRVDIKEQLSVVLTIIFVIIFPCIFLTIGSIYPTAKIICGVLIFVVPVSWWIVLDRL